VSELDHYDYELPRELIAQAPALNRIDARLLVVRRDQRSIAHHHVRDLPDLLRPGDCLVLNNTQVIPARLEGFRTGTGGHFEGLFLESNRGLSPTTPTDGSPVNRDDRDDQPPELWHLMCKTRGKLKPGETVTLRDADGREGLRLEMVGQQEDGTWVVAPLADEPALDLLHRVGRVPLPPYIRHGRMAEADREHYQTTYAARPGAIAAPTAGLHFTQGLLERLAALGVEICYLTLHVGPGTFRPMTSERVAEHQLDPEWGDVDQATVDRIQAVRDAGGRVIAVGTTSVRLLETAAREGALRPYRGQTDLFIHPPFEFRVVDCLMTNFHLPRTSLLVLVRTFGGDALISRAYEEAVVERYRFYSYGDAMLIL